MGDGELIRRERYLVGVDGTLRDPNLIPFLLEIDRMNSFTLIDNPIGRKNGISVACRVVRILFNGRGCRVRCCRLRLRLSLFADVSPSSCSLTLESDGASPSVAELSASRLSPLRSFCSLSALSLRRLLLRDLEVD